MEPIRAVCGGDGGILVVAKGPRVALFSSHSKVSQELEITGASGAHITTLVSTDTHVVCGFQNGDIGALRWVDLRAGSGNLAVLLRAVRTGLTAGPLVITALYGQKGRSLVAVGGSNGVGVVVDVGMGKVLCGFGEPSFGQVTALTFSAVPLPSIAMAQGVHVAVFRVVIDLSGEVKIHPTVTLRAPPPLTNVTSMGLSFSFLTLGGDTDFLVVVSASSGEGKPLKVIPTGAATTSSSSSHSSFLVYSGALGPLVRVSSTGNHAETWYPANLEAVVGVCTFSSGAGVSAPHDLCGVVSQSAAEVWPLTVVSGSAPLLSVSL